LIVRLVLCPDGKVAGRLGEVSEKYFVVKAALLIVSGALPEFVAVTVSDLLEPAGTLPKDRLALPIARLPSLVPVPPAPRPIHPVSNERPHAINSDAATCLVKLVGDFLTEFFLILSLGALCVSPQAPEEL